MLYHHTRPLESVSHEEVLPKPEFSNELDIKGLRWLEIEIGFFPIFTSVGDFDVCRRETGYQNNWRKLLVTSPQGNEYRKKGEFSNEVLFSFEDLNRGVYVHSDYFISIVLLSTYYGHKVSEKNKKSLFKKSYTESRWLNLARKYPGWVYYLVPKLDLPSAKEIWVRNKKTKKTLEDMGFDQVIVKRLEVEKFL